MTKKVKKTAKKTTKKPVKRAKTDKAFAEFGKKLKAEKDNIKVSPIVDSTGTVTMKSTDDVGETASNPGTTVKPVIDKETGVLTMVPVDEVK